VITYVLSFVDNIVVQWYHIFLTQGGLHKVDNYSSIASNWNVGCVAQSDHEERDNTAAQFVAVVENSEDQSWHVNNMGLPVATSHLRHKSIFPPKIF
jgi:hypothetical protein